MEPTIKTDKYTLYHGDCLDVLPTLEPGTGVAAVKNQRRFIGGDIVKRWVDYAYRDIANISGDYVTTPKERERGQMALWDLQR